VSYTAAAGGTSRSAGLWFHLFERINNTIVDIARVSSTSDGALWSYGWKNFRITAGWSGNQFDNVYVSCYFSVISA
jgi:hypothetical protein